MVSFLDEVQMFHNKLKGEQYDINDEFKIIKPLLDAHGDILKYAQQTAHIHSFWCSDFFMTTPVARCVVTHLVFEKLSKLHDKPITWFYLLPHKIVIDTAYQKVIFVNEDIKFLDDEGYAKPVTKAAFHAALAQGIIPEDEEFLFQDDPESLEFLTHTKEVIQQISDSLGLSIEDAVKHLTGENFDFTFPHESDKNDDSL